MKYTQVRNCRYSNQDGTKIDCEVLFEKLGWVEFTSSPDDLPHSVEIFQKASAGDFGEVGPFIPTPSNEIQISPETVIRNKRNSLLLNLDSTVNNPLRWASFTEEEKLDFARYRQELLDVPQQQGFPSNVVWPTPPSKLTEPQSVSFSIIM